MNIEPRFNRGNLLLPLANSIISEAWNFRYDQILEHWKIYSSSSSLQLSLADYVPKILIVNWSILGIGTFEQIMLMKNNADYPQNYVF